MLLPLILSPPLFFHLLKNIWFFLRFSPTFNATKIMNLFAGMEADKKTRKNDRVFFIFCPKKKKKKSS